jgi:ankyrin repeat protein
LRDFDGRTAVQLAHILGHDKCVKLLIGHGADESSLQGIEFDSDAFGEHYTMQVTDFRRKARYCEYPECSSNKEEKDLKVCTRCKIVHYCCAEHQKLRWKEHKKICKALI